MLQEKLEKASRDASKRFLNGLLLTATVAVVLLLDGGNGNLQPVADTPAAPEIATETAKAVPAPSAETPAPAKAAAPDPPTDPDREAFRARLSDFETGIEPRIAAADFAHWDAAARHTAMSAKEQAVSAFTGSDYGEALRHIENAEKTALAALEARDRAFAEAMEQAEGARARDDYETAKLHVGEALRIYHGSPEAAALGAEIEKLPPLLAHLDAARTARAENDPAAEYDSLSMALALDPDRTEIRERVAELSRLIQERRFTAEVDAAVRHLESRDHAAARRAFDAAERILPGRPELAALEGRIAALGREMEAARLVDAADKAAGKDDWQTARDLYARADDIQPGDPAVVARRDTAADIVAFKGELDAHLSAPGRLSSVKVAHAAEELLERTRPFAPLSPELAAASAELRKLVAAYDAKVPVVVASDGLTRVSVRSVGHVGAVTKKLIHLRPGRYTFEGRRDGHKAKMVSVEVPPGGEPVRVEVVCDEPL